MGRYKKLMVDGKFMELILMDQVAGAFELPEKFKRFVGLKVIEMPRATNREAAEHLRDKWGISI